MNMRLKSFRHKSSKFTLTKGDLNSINKNDSKQNISSKGGPLINNFVVEFPSQFLKFKKTKTNLNKTSVLKTQNYDYNTKYKSIHLNNTNNTNSNTNNNTNNNISPNNNLSNSNTISNNNGPSTYQANETVSAYNLKEIGISSDFLRIFRDLNNKRKNKVSPISKSRIPDSTNKKKDTVKYSKNLKDNFKSFDLKINNSSEKNTLIPSGKNEMNTKSTSKNKKKSGTNYNKNNININLSCISNVNNNNKNHKCQHYNLVQTRTNTNFNSISNHKNHNINLGTIPNANTSNYGSGYNTNSNTHQNTNHNTNNKINTNTTFINNILQNKSKRTSITKRTSKSRSKNKNKNYKEIKPHNTNNNNLNNLFYLKKKKIDNSKLLLNKILTTKIDLKSKFSKEKVNRSDTTDPLMHNKATSTLVCSNITNKNDIKREYKSIENNKIIQGLVSKVPTRNKSRPLNIIEAGMHNDKYSLKKDFLHNKYYGTNSLGSFRNRLYTEGKTVSQSREREDNIDGGVNQINIQLYSQNLTDSNEVNEDDFYVLLQNNMKKGYSKNFRKDKNTKQLGVGHLNNNFLNSLNKKTTDDQKQYYKKNTLNYQNEYQFDGFDKFDKIDKENYHRILHELNDLNDFVPVCSENTHSKNLDETESPLKHSTEVEKEQNNSGVLSYDQVKDIIVYYDMDNIEKKQNFLFKNNDYVNYITGKRKEKYYAYFFGLTGRDQISGKSYGMKSELSGSTQPSGKIRQNHISLVTIS